MSLYITSQNLTFRTYSQLLAQASNNNELVYFNHKNATFCVSDRHPENFVKVSDQRIYEISRRFSENYLKHPEEASNVSTSLKYYQNLRDENESKRNPLIKLIFKIYQAIKNLFKGFGLHTSSTLLGKMAAELAPVAGSAPSSPGLEKKVSPPREKEPKEPLAEEEEKAVQKAEKKVEKVPEPHSEPEVIREPSPEPIEEQVDKSPPPTIKHAHSQRKLTKRQSMNFGRLCIELRLAGDIHQFEGKIRKMSESGDGIFQLFALDGGPAIKFDDSRTDFLTKILKPLDFDKRQIVVKYLLDFPSFNANVFCDLFHVLFTYEHPENEYQVTDSMKQLRTFYQENPEIADSPQLSEEDRIFLEKRSISVG